MVEYNPATGTVTLAEWKVCNSDSLLIVQDTDTTIANAVKVDGKEDDEIITVEDTPQGR